MSIRTMIVDDEPLAVERLQMLCAREQRIALVGTATDGEAALRLIEGLKPDLVMLDIAMPLLDGIGVARAVGRMGIRPAVIFVTAFEGFAVEAFDLAAIDYMLKPVAHDRLTRAIDRVEAVLRNRAPEGIPAPAEPQPDWAEEFWVPHRSELIRIATDQIDRIEAERDYMRLHVGSHSYLLHQTISSLEERLDPQQFVRLHRSHIVRRDHIARLRHDGSGVWFAALVDGNEIRIGRTFLANARAMTGR
ncbi:MULTISPECIES: LytR/AlgR family response regulator transcription factor [unclassified Sphingobium]|uniref:LytR/AlgR family response regulator transcription factor n=1 Tax=unclassified Sphingobium TaxID=2611147 RepID=UPI000D16865A|nr:MULTISPECIES: LytTR family DNA-binding domain-containing protein [unclassified Sphingobium]MBG6119608.1 two-component system response regulator AlgR [Sphingobium sp. JAI105]PSO13306.1 DNA-binding response regulator [Sphingobium sp. AEW4]TWD11540.1 LytTR family two component transcriptional regulator [Sphingobium sp. AEW010]TWD28569.1 LytTR family two component transcriptional regulator [Sphingobium sp. AEW013]TWD30082.1 LytTR family two component transcriptional regulator [Sphingobium sp. A